MNMKAGSSIREAAKFLRLTSFDTSTEVGRSHERYRRIALSGVSGLASRVITAMLGLVTVPLAINYLGKELFGLWMIVTSLVLWMQLADFGITGGLTNALSEAHGRDDRAAAGAYISTAFAATSIISLLCVLPLVVLAQRLPWDFILNVQNASLAHLAANCFIGAGLVFIICLPLTVLNRVYAAYQLSYVENIVQIVSAVCALAGVVIAVAFRLSLPWLVVFVSSGSLFGNLLSWLIVRRYLPWCRLERGLISRSALRRVARSSVPLFLFQVGALLVNQMVNIVLAQAGSLRTVADYNVLLRIYLLIFALGISLSAPFYPAIREAFERKEREWVLRSLHRVIFARLAVVAIFGVPLVFIGDWLIRSWVHESLDGYFGQVGWVSFISSLLLATVSSVLGEILIGLDEIWSQMKIVFLSAAVVLSGTYYFVPSVGLAGVYLAISFSTLYPIVWSYKRLHSRIAED